VPCDGPDGPTTTASSPNLGECAADAHSELPNCLRDGIAPISDPVLKSS
jgi:hypothetical protein